MGKEFDGITVGGESVESFLVDKRVKDVLDTMVETKHYTKKRGRARYMEQKEPNGKAVSLRENVVRALIAGQVLTVKKVCEDYNIPHPQSAGAILRSIFLSEFGDMYMKREEFKGNDASRMVLNYFIPEYIGATGVKFKDINIALKTAIKLSRNTLKVGKRSPTPNPVTKFPELTLIPIIKDVVLNLIIKIKVEIV